MQGLLFDRYILNNKIDNIKIDDIDNKLKILKGWVNKFEILSQKNEKNLQPIFFETIFKKVLDYTDLITDEDVWSIQFEEKTEVDSTKPDGILGVYTNSTAATYAVIELKGFDVDLDKKQMREGKNYGTPVDQAYSYAHKFDDCEWIIVSNMLEIRLYKNGTSQNFYESFYLNDILNEADFKKFYFLLTKNSIVQPAKKSPLLNLVEKTNTQKQKITKEFYTYYSQTRSSLWETLKKNNSGYDDEILLEKSQKILNRITFIRFCEANNLLKANTLKSFYEEGKNSKLSSWEFLETLFNYIDKGNTKNDINRYNGGLFKEDTVLNNIVIPDKDFEVIEKFFDYNFKDELTIDILGHIFEQSISDIEALKGIKKEEVGSRKANGVFYTPEYITSYIVKDAIDDWIENEKVRLDFNSLTDWKNAKSKSAESRSINRHIEKLKELKEALNNIKILDAACGSGAFLIKVFEYLVQKHKEIQKEIADLNALRTGGIENNLALDLDMDREILKNNIYGIDLNKESVEITKLSLWLQTANNKKPLTTLDDNIIVGNSIVNDEEIAPARVINWEKEFTSVQEKGGFDIIVGNPPYVPIDFLDSDTSEYFQEEYQDILKNKWDISVIFMHKCVSFLNSSGVLSMIVPRTWLTGANYTKFREVFSNELNLNKIISLPKDVFPDANVDTCIFIGTKDNPGNKIEKNYLAYKYDIKAKISVLNVIDDDMDSIPIDFIKQHHMNKIFTDINSYKLYNKIQVLLKDESNYTQLGSITDSTQGPVESKFEYSTRPITKYHIPYLKDGQGYRYRLNVESSNYINLSEKQTLISYYVKQPRLYCRRIVNRQDRLMVSYCENVDGLHLVGQNF
ncbi:hypothetical protein bcgnr5416_31170 [Bacillus cereus]